MDIQLSNAAECIIEVLSEAGGRPFLVGGMVRDALMGIKPKDVDIEVHGLSMEQIQEALKDYNTDVVGVQFGVLKVTGRGGEFDISIPRRDSKIGVGHTGFQMEFDPNISIEEASARRDFTMNSIMVDAVTGRVHDPHGGAADILSKTIRHASDAFAEDPLRVLRAVQFAARFGFEVHPSTLELCKKLLPEFDTIAKERIWVEWEKIGSKGRDFGPAFRALKGSGWSLLFGNLEESCVERFNMAALRCETHGIVGEARVSVAIAALAAESNGFTLKHGEPEVFLHMIGAPNKVTRDALLLVRNQSVGGFSPERQARILARNLAPLGIREAHCIGGVTDEIAESAKRQGCFRAALTPFLTGNDLISRGHKPGKAFGPFLETMTRKQDWGRISSREEALAWLDKHGHMWLSFDL